MQKQTGIIMSGDHPVKVLDGTKTQTRRTYGLERINKTWRPDEWSLVGEKPDGWQFRHKDGQLLTLKCPYGRVGDLLWVREAAAHRIDGVHQILYKADYEAISTALDLPDFSKRSGLTLPKPSFSPSIHLFRKDCRAEMPITILRPERLQDISHADACQEGCKVTIDEFQPGCSYMAEDYKQNFQRLWDRLNSKKYPWAGNWWVWVVGWSKLSKAIRN